MTELMSRAPGRLITGGLTVFLRSLSLSLPNALGIYIVYIYIP